MGTTRSDEGSRSSTGRLPVDMVDVQHHTTNDAHPIKSLGFVRSLVWVALIMTIVLSATLSIYLGSANRQTLLKKNYSFSSLLAEYLNNQVYRRFTAPTLALFGRIALRNPAQYKQLDQIVQSIIQGMQVDDLRIFSNDHTVTYATDTDELGSKDFASPQLSAAAGGDVPIFTLEAEQPYWRAFFSFSLPPGTFKLRTTYPMRIENRLTSSMIDGPIMGVLEFSQDITPDIEGAIRYQQLIIAVTLSGAGLLFLVLLLFVRRTERALAVRMAEKQRLVQELHQSEKLAGMGRVVASIAHEIRNPLGIISSSAELLIKRTAQMDPATNRILNAIYDEARRLSRTVSDFLDYARPRQPKQELVDVSLVITQALSFLEHDLADRDIGVVRSGELDLPLYAHGDKDLLYRAFYNIMGNAVQAMGAAGTLTITHTKTTDPIPQVHIIFHDSGSGFPEESLEQLLDPFFTTKDDGTGLGLPIVSNIITSHGGTMELRNGSDGGAEVRVILPGTDATE